MYALTMVLLITSAVLALLSSSVNAETSTPNAHPAQSGFAVVGYLPEYRLHGFDYEAAFQTGVTHLLFFSLEIDTNGRPSARDRLPTKQQAREARNAADKVGGK